MDIRNEWKKLSWIVVGFLALYFLPVGNNKFDNAIMESLHLVKWYAQEHVLLCLIPAFFIAGAISVFVSQASVMKYLGANANKFLAYTVASFSGTILAVCSCTILPLFSGIYKMGAGLGPASAFLYSGPAINILAIVLTAKILGAPLGIARAVGAIFFSVIIGLLMHFIFKKEEVAKANKQMMMPKPEVSRPLYQNALYFLSMVGILVFANWGRPQEVEGVWFFIYSFKWPITTAFYIAFNIILWRWFNTKAWKLCLGLVFVSLAFLLTPNNPLVPFTVGFVILAIIANTGNDESKDWISSTWTYAKQILPLLLFGVIIAGFLLGRPETEGIIPKEWIVSLVGGNSLGANFFASFAGAFMYFATLTEVPILQGLIGNGMGQGPALALLLAGPALSLPNMLVIKSIMGTKKTVVFVSLVIIMATISGIVFGHYFS
ncbi:MAG: permease [Bdellovibrionales bacterium RIFOXYA1_FULL_36_14]|nr:MAG: permease [Bdellovibrionales bacterium RIFOXYA1_FULL_36_14]